MTKAEAVKLLQAFLASLRLTVQEHAQWAEALRVLTAEEPKKEATS